MNVSGDATKDYFCPMTVIEAPKPVLRGPAVWPLGVKAYHALGDLGLIPEKTELLYGQIFHKMSQSPLHSFLSEFLEDILRGAVPSGCHVRGEEPLTLGDSEPEPDLAVVRGRREDFRQAHPTTAELVIEVCVTSHDFDRSKLRAYASASVKECWLVLGPENRSKSTASRRARTLPSTLSTGRAGGWRAPRFRPSPWSWTASLRHEYE